jgi:hypothetical protein
MKPLDQIPWVTIFAAMNTITAHPAAPASANGTTTSADSPRPARLFRWYLLPQAEQTKIGSRPEIAMRVLKQRTASLAFNRVHDFPARLTTDYISQGYFWSHKPLSA